MNSPLKLSVLLLLLLVLVVSQPSFAQIVISSNNYQPPVGTILQSAMAEIDSVFYLTVSSGTGGGHLWDFSSLSFDDLDSTTVVDVASSPAAASFPDANLCLFFASDGDSGWSYSESVPGYYQQLGSFFSSDSGDFEIVYYDLAPEYVFPLQYGNSWTAHRHSDFDVMGIATTTADSTFYEVEAHGQVKFGSNVSACLRIKSIERVWSVVTIQGVPFSTFTLQVERYDFITADLLSAFSVSKVNTPFGSSIYSCTASKEAIEQGTLVVEYDQTALPTSFSVGQNFPNPFNPSTSISYSLPRPAGVKLDIINIAGRIVKHFDLGQQPAGTHTVTVDLMNDVSQNLASGVYFYRFSAGDFQETRKMMLLK